MVQQVKDSFYMVLRERLGELNPERTTVVEGALRPAIVVEENECSETADNTFRLSWGRCSPLAGHGGLAKVDCTFTYSTRGVNGTGSDRGRQLGQLDAELTAISNPPRTMVMDYSVIPTKSSGTMVFWTDLEFAEPVDEAGRIKREAKTTVYFLRAEEVSS
jgi:hypothetical protein